MGKEWILNNATTRFQFNFSQNVGKVSEEIRKCSPRVKDDWERYYFENVRTKEHLQELGKRLYTKTTEVLHAEISEITEQDCIDYIFNLVIDRTFDGYVTEKVTIYEQLQKILGIPIEPAPDKWDRNYNVDFFIQVNGKFVGLQVKPVSGTPQITQIHSERRIQENTHVDFTKKYGGKVFYVYSAKQNKQKKIVNTEVIDEIKSEIQRLQSM